MIKSFQKPIAIALLAGFLVGIVWFVAVRYVMYQSNTVHYHANFSLYINGKHDEFKSFTFYEEVQACTSEADNDPKHRVHMHNQENDVIHVHAPAVTWGAFFDNLGYSLGDKSIETDDGVFANNDTEKLTFTLNGQQVDKIANRLMASEDRLLINYGNDDTATLQSRFNEVASSAAEKNTQQDPASCSGSVKLTPLNRLKKVIGL